VKLQKGKLVGFAYRGRWVKITNGVHNINDGKKINKVVDNFFRTRLSNTHADFQHPRHWPLLLFLLFLFLVHPRLWSGGGLLVQKVRREDIANDLYERAAGEESPAALFF